MIAQGRLDELPLPLRDPRVVVRRVEDDEFPEDAPHYRRDSKEVEDQLPAVRVDQPARGRGDHEDSKHGSWDRIIFIHNGKRRIQQATYILNVFCYFFC